MSDHLCQLRTRGYGGRWLMRSAVIAGVCAVLLMIGLASAALSAEPAAEPVEREILVPFADLGEVLREPGAERIMMSRKEFADLLGRARRSEATRPPHQVMLLSASYQATVADERAEIVGELVISVLDSGLHIVPFELSGVGLRRAELDGRSAAIGVADDGRLTLIVEGRGEHRLVLTMIVPVQTTAASQAMTLQLPVAPASRLQLTVAGDIELRSGSAVVTRKFDEESERTVFDLLPVRGPMTLVMTLNSRQKRSERLLVSRSMLVSEVTESYERLHATMSTMVLHMAVDRLRFALPDGFEVAEVASAHMARWAVVADGERRILEVTLREETTDTVLVKILAMRMAPDLSRWTMPKLEPLDVVSQVAVVGLLVEDRLKAASLRSDGLAAIDVTVLEQVMPASALSVADGHVAVRPVVAYYAAQPAFSLTGTFIKPPSRLLVTTNLLLILEDRGLSLRGGFAVLPQEEKLFNLDVAVPSGWDVTAVTNAEGQSLPFQRHERDGGMRLKITLPAPLPAGQQQSVYFEAVHVPQGWLDEWPKPLSIPFPACWVIGATRDVGAIAVDARDDLAVTAGTSQLSPLDETEKAAYGLSAAGTALAFRYDGQPYSADLTVERKAPQLKARTVSLFRLAPGALVAAYEITWEAGRARASTLSFSLPATTPEALSVVGQDGVQVKELTSSVEDGQRVWTVVLAEPRAGNVTLTVDLLQRLEGDDIESLALPLVRATDLENQTGLAAVEGSADLDVRILSPSPRRVDVGELASSRCQVGPRLLGAFSVVHPDETLMVSMSRPAVYALPSAIVQKAEITTVISDRGVAQTAARYRLSTQSQFLEISLPEKATLWAASLDGQPLQPQRDGERLLVGLGNSRGVPAGLVRRVGGEVAMAQADPVRDLLIVYSMPTASLGVWTGLKLPAPRLVLRDEGGGRGEVPMADLEWRLYLPHDFAAVRAEGLASSSIEPPPLAVTSLATTMAGVVSGRRYAQDAPAIEFLGGVAGSYAYKTEEPSLAPPAPAPAAEELMLPTLRLPPQRAITPMVQPPLSERADDRADQVLNKFHWRGGYATGEVLRSLNIDLAPTGVAVIFRGLGGDPQLRVTVADTSRLESLALALRLGVLLVGLMLTRRRMRVKLAYVIFVALAASLLPLVVGRMELALVFNPAFYATILLVLWYLLAALVGLAWRGIRGRFGGRVVATATIAAAIATAMLLTSPVMAAETRGSYVIKVVEPPAPIAVPADAIIVPYDPERLGDRPDQLLVPMGRFKELWNLAHPDAALETVPPPMPYAMAGAAYTARLSGDDTLTLDGAIEIDVFVDEYVTVLLPLEGGVLSRAQANGKPARLGIITTPPAVPMQQQAAQAQQQAASLNGSGRLAGTSAVAIHLKGKGRHRLELSVRMQLERRGGWRVAAGRVPVAPATELTLRVPDAATEVQLDGVKDRRLYETTSADETIRTALERGGLLRVQWRPKIGEGHVDQGLTCHSTAIVDVQEDSVRVAWSLALQFRRSERETISFRIPAGYHIEKVEGANVRGWQVDSEVSPPRLDVSLLRAARDSESFTLSLWRPGPIGHREGQEIDVPVVDVPEALRHSGRLTIRRSPLLGLVTLSARGVTRTNLPAQTAGSLLMASDESPLGIEAYQAYDFVTSGFSIRLSATPIESDVTAEMQTILRLSERHRALESRMLLTVRRRPIHKIRLLIPGDLELEQVLAPGRFEWAVTDVADDADRKLLTVYLGSGGTGQVPLVIMGRLSDRQQLRNVSIPRIAALDVRQQQGHIVVQVDPAFEVALLPEQQKGLEVVPKSQVFNWLGPAQREPARLVMKTRSADYAGRLTLAKRSPTVTAVSVSNVRVTDREIQETILLDFTITNAGIRQVTFVLPASMREATFRAPLLKRTIITPTGPEDGAAVRVTIELQDEVMQQLRVLVENDRPLSRGRGEAPIPVIETGRTMQRFVAIESAGRDEVIVEQAEQLDVIGRQQREWAVVSELFQGGSTRAYMVRSSAVNPRLSYATHRREEIETAGASIELAEAILVVDVGGAFRGVQTFHVDNRTEQFLEITLPAGATLWTAHVAGKAVKPVLPAGASPAGRNVLIPLEKMSAGDLNYSVVLKYGGNLPSLRSLKEVEFPLVQAVNLSVGVSQVRLWLPDGYKWIDFAGNMRLVEEEALTQERVSYETRQVQKLSKAVQSDNPFAVQRALDNAGILWQNESLRDNDELRQVERQGRQVLELEASQYDNRGRFNTVFEQQSNVRASQMQNVDDNWDLADIDGRDSGSQPTFNEKWLEKGKLGADKKARQDESITNDLRAGDKSVASPADPGVFKRDSKPGDFGESVPRFNLTGSLEGRRDVDRDIPSTWSDFSASRRRYVAQSTGESFGVGGGGFAYGGVAVETAGGLASLDVEITMRGTEYRFTTPRGDVAITARPVSRPLIGSFTQVGLILLTIAVVAGIVWLVNRLRRRFPAVAITGGLLILLGLLGMIWLPVQSLALLVVGLVLLLVYRWQLRNASRADY